MSTIVFPPSLTPAQATWELTHNVAGGSNPWGQVQRISRGSPVWSCSFAMPTLEGEDMAIWQAFEAQAARGDVRFYMPHPVPLRGSFDNSELLVNGDFTNGTSGWSTTEASLVAGSRLLKVTNASANEGRAEQFVSLTAGRSVVVVADWLAGNVATAEVLIRDVTAGSTLATVTSTTPGRIIVSATVANTGSHLLQLRVNTNVAGDYVYYESASMSRCMITDGGSQTGTKLTVRNAIPASTNGQLKRGDMFTVMIDGVPSLHRLTRDFDSNSTGRGTLFFEPALPGTVSDGQPVILRNPFCRMYIPSHNASSAYKPPMHGSFALEAVEDPTRP